MVGIISHRLNLFEASMLVDGEEIEAEQAVLDAILDDRVAGLHRPVTWRSIDRDVCTCSLVLPHDQSVAEAVGHVDPQTHRLEGTILVEDDGLRVGVCQHCGATFRDESFDQLHRWQEVHVCPPDEPEAEVKVDPVDFDMHRVSESYFRSIVAGHVRRMHPRSDGPSLGEGLVEQE
ncbi:hypothetical protein ASG90_06760 [Nocardioides sp. Soil797]|nr:hypothetical protein ASG90_06760 [Nocardioides sp. Soil797]